MITINNNSIIGKNITITGNRIIIDGKDVTNNFAGKEKEISIIVTGNIETLFVDYSKSIDIKGNVGNFNNGSGNVTCHDIEGDIHTGSGNISSNSIKGNVRSGSGNIKAEHIQGSVTTVSGVIKR